MNRLHWLRRYDAFVLMLAIGATSGCINSDKFTSGRLPYGGSADGLAASSPRDPFLTGGSQQPNATGVASATPGAQPTNYDGSPNAPYYAAVQNANSQAPQYPTQPGALQPQQFAGQVDPSQIPQYAMHANSPQAQPYAMPAGAPQPQQYAMNGVPAGAPMADMRQVSYTPSADNPFNVPPSAPPASQPMPPQMQGSPSGSSIEQISYEMPVGMPAGAVYEANPFAEVQGTADVSTYQQAMPQIQPMNGADAWQPSTSSASGYAGEGFLPPQ